MKGRIIMIAAALLVSTSLGMIGVPKDLAHAQMTAGLTGNFTTEDLGVIRGSLNDARQALLADDSAEAMDELNIAQESIIGLFSEAQTEQEDDVAAATDENQIDATTAQNLTSEDLNIVQQSLNSVRAAIHANDIEAATEELTTAYEEISSTENEE
jgi:hypothetical protein